VPTEDAIDGFADQPLDLLGGMRAALCEASHFARDHCKAAALFARTGGLDRCV